MARYWLVGLAMIVLVPAAQAADGVIKVESPRSAKETVDRLEATAKARGMTVFARIDHAAGAEKVGKKLRPTEVLIFGNPQGGTPFMECAQSVGLDLPQRMLAWQDEAGKTWLGYNDPAYLAKRHGATCAPVVEATAKALAGLAAEATAK
jgi:uncharacterized protein (DUF302 family)